MKHERSTSSSVNEDQNERIRRLENEVLQLKQDHETTTSTANTLVTDLTNLLSKLQNNAVTANTQLSSQQHRQFDYETALNQLHRGQNRDSVIYASTVEQHARRIHYLGSIVGKQQNSISGLNDHLARVNIPSERDPSARADVRMDSSSSCPQYIGMASQPTTFGPEPLSYPTTGENRIGNIGNGPIGGPFCTPSVTNQQIVPPPSFEGGNLPSGNETLISGGICIGI